jgi:ribosomal protein L20
MVGLYVMQFMFGCFAYYFMQVRSSERSNVLIQVLKKSKVKAALKGCTFSAFVRLLEEAEWKMDRKTLKKNIIQAGYTYPSHHRSNPII